MLVIETEGLSRSYGTVRAVENLDLRVRQGELYGFLGLNGAGKTSTIRMLLGLIKPDHGSIRLFGRYMPGDRLEVLGRIGSLVETASAWPKLTVRENLDSQASLLGLSRQESSRVIGLLGLEGYQNRMAGQLSLGMRQRLSLARAIMGRPGLLILDEPSNGLDPAGIVEIRLLLRQLVEQEGMTILMSSHLLDEVEHLADRVGIMHRGKLVQELVLEEFRANPGQIEFGIDRRAGFDRAELLRLLLARWPSLSWTDEKGGDAIFLRSSGELRDPTAVPAAAELNRILVEAGYPVSRLGYHKPDLEALFLSYTGQEGRS